MADEVGTGGYPGHRAGRKPGVSGFPPPPKGGGETGKPTPGVGPAPRALSEAEQQRIASNRQKVRELAPELLPVIADLHAEGLIEGWRAVRYIGPCDVSEQAA
jgi:hypothetical protein